MKTIHILITFLLLTLSLNAREIGDVNLKETMGYEGGTLQLLGGGVREKFFLDLYVAGLYTVVPEHDAAKLTAADAPMAISLQIVSSLISSEKMQKATREGFKKSTGGNTAPVAGEIESFMATFDAPIVENDVYTFVYRPGFGVDILKNGRFEKRIAGLAFKRALFGIWLGEEPAQESLKAGMVGQ